jgi:outer membrane receptor for ferrienterochelin and colicins
MKILPVLILTIPSLSASNALAEQSKELIQLLNMTLEELMHVTITIASKNKETVAQAPSSVTVFTRNQIEAMGITELGELLNQMVGTQMLFDVVPSGPTHHTSVRGSVGFGNDVLYLLNGQRLNNYHSNAVNMIYRRISLHNVEKIEVIRGPGSALYGSGAFAGVINVITTDAHDERNDITLEIGENQSVRGAVNLSHNTEKWGVALSAQTISDDGQSYSGLYDRFNRTDGNAHDPKRGHDLMLTAHYGDFKFNIFHTAHDTEDYYLFRGGLSPRNYLKTESTLFNVSYQHEINDSLSGYYRLGMQRGTVEGVALNGVGGSVPFPQDDVFVGPDFTHEMRNGEAYWIWQAHPTHTLTFGVNREEAESPQAYTQANYDIFAGRPPLPYLNTVTRLPARLVADEKVIINGLFVQDEWRIDDAWSLTTGVRYDNYNLADNVFSPRAAVVYRANKQNTFKLLYGQAFNAPSLSVLYNTTGGNPNIQPTTLRSWEFAWWHEQRDFRNGMTLFYNEINDAIALIPASGGSYSSVNADEQRTSGLEVETSWQPTLNWQFSANYTYFFKNRTSFPAAAGTPRPEDWLAQQFGSVRINYQYKKFNINLNGIVSDNAKALPQNTIAVFNLMSSYRYTPALELFVNVKNLFDEEYYAIATGNGLGIVDGNAVRELPYRGRWLYTGLKYSF